MVPGGAGVCTSWGGWPGHGNAETPVGCCFPSQKPAEYTLLSSARVLLPLVVFETSANGRPLETCPIIYRNTSQTSEPLALP